MKRRWTIVLSLTCFLLCFVTACKEAEREEPTAYYSIAVATLRGGTLAAPESASAGESVTVTATPDEGYSLEAFFVNSERSELTFTMPQTDVVLFAVFAGPPEEEPDGPKPVTVIASNGSASAASEAMAGEKVAVEVLPDEGYEFEKLVVNGVDVYGKSFLMPDEEATVRAVFREKIVYRASELTVSCTTYDSYLYKNFTAESRWFFEYGEEGVTVSVQVSDDNYYPNYYLGDGYYNDNIEFTLCKTTDSGALPADAFKVIVSADGNYFLSEANASGSGYGGYKADRGLVYGKNFYVSARSATKEDNGFDGYYATAFIGYDVLKTTAEEARGNLSIMPALRNTIYVTGGFTLSNWACFSRAGAGWVKANTFPVCNADGSFGLRAIHADYVFFGDSYFDKKSFWTTFDNYFTDVDAVNIAVGGTMVTQWLDKLQDIADFTPDKVVAHIGINDLNNRLLSGEHDETKDAEAAEELTADITRMFENLHALLPEASLYWVSMPYMSAIPGTHDAGRVVNTNMARYAQDCEYLTMIDIEPYMTMDDAPALGAQDGGHVDVGAHPLYAALIREALGLKAEERGKTWGASNIFRSTYGADLKDDGVDGTLYQTGVGTQYIYLDDFYSKDFYVEAEFGVSRITNGDPFPKFGFTVTTRTHRMNFYVDCTPYITAERVGIVDKWGYDQYDWSRARGAAVDGMSFANGNFVKLALLRYNGKITFYVNDKAVITERESALGGELAAVGVFTFNTLMTVKNTVALCGTALRDHLLGDDGDSDRDTTDADKDWTIPDPPLSEEERDVIGDDKDWVIPDKSKDEEEQQ